jgi:hypothetical protein
MHSELSDQQVEALMNYQAITENYDQTQALTLLQQNSWDPSVLTSQAAAQHYFAMSLGDSTPPPPRREPVSSPSLPPPQVLVPEEEPEDPGFLRRAWSGVTYISSSLINGIFSWFGYGATPAPPQRPQSLQSSAAFLSEAYSGLVLPTFSGNSLRGVLEEARSSGRPLLIYIHSPGVSEAFMREVLCSTVIIEVVNHNFLAWGSSDSSGEGRALMRNLGVRSAPSFAVVTPGTSESPILLDAIVRDRQEGEGSLEDLFSFLDNGLTLFREHRGSSEASSRSSRNTRVDPARERDKL